MSVRRIKFLVPALLIALSGCAHRKYLEESCYEGLRNRCVELAEDLLQHREEAQAVNWLARACDLGHWGSCLRHASLFEWGWGVEQDWPRARRLYDATCQHKVKEACQARDRLDQLDALTQCRPMGREEFEATRNEVKKLQEDSVVFCMQLRGGRDARIDVKVEAIVETDGRASSVRIVENSAPDLAVGECAREQMMKWHFPCPPKKFRFIMNVQLRP